MASNFIDYSSGATTVSAPANHVTPQAPVQPVGVQPDHIPDALNTLFKSGGALASAFTANKESGFLAAFNTKQLSIIQGIDQGKISSQFGRTQMRANLAQAINDYPLIQDKILQANAALLGNAGMGQVVTQGTNAEQTRLKLNNELISKGLALPDDPPDVLAKKAQNFQLATAEHNRYQMTMDTIALEKAQAGLDSTKQAALKQKQSQATVDYLAQTAPSEMDHFQTFAQGIIAGVQSGKITAADGVAAVENRWALFQQNMAPYAARITSDQAKAFTKAFETVKNLTEDQINGKIDSTIAKQKLSALTDGSMIDALKVPEISKAYIGTKIFGNNLPLMQGVDVQGIAARYFNQNSTDRSADPNATSANPYSLDPTELNGLKAYTNILGTKVDWNDPQQVKEASTQLKNLLHGAISFQSVLQSSPKAATAAKGLVSWFASPNFLKLSQQHPELMGDMSSVKDVISRNYADQVWGLVRREFRDNNVALNNNFSIKSGAGGMANVSIPSPDMVKATDLVTYQPSADGVKFISIDPNNKAGVAKAAELNSQLAPVINTTVKAIAHLEGSTDYSKVFQESAGSVLNKTGVMSNLTENDFTIPKLAPKGSGIAKIVDQTEGGGSYDTLYGFANTKEGNPFNGVKVSNMTVGEAIQFSKGLYGQYMNQEYGYHVAPMGRYQIIGQTLQGAASALGLSMDTPFNSKTQDAIFGYLVNQALAGKTDEASKREALRSVWEGFRKASDDQLDKAIAEWEGKS